MSKRPLFVPLHLEQAVAHLQNPECDHEIWWICASYRPVEAMDSPLYPLFLLEAPQRWQSMQDANLWAWLNQYTKLLPWRRHRKFIFLCVEHAVKSYVSPKKRASFATPLHWLRVWAYGHLPDLVYDRRLVYWRHDELHYSNLGTWEHRLRLFVSRTYLLRDWPWFAEMIRGLANAVVTPRALKLMEYYPERYEARWQWQTLLPFLCKEPNDACSRTEPYL